MDIQQQISQLKDRIAELEAFGDSDLLEQARANLAGLMARQSTYPLTMLWPATDDLAVPAGQWTRRADGRIEAVYQCQAELTTCNWVMRALRGL